MDRVAAPIVRKCRFCQQTIDAAARVCVHCGKDLVPVHQPVEIAGPPVQVRSIPMAVDAISTAPISRVAVVDIDMPMGSMVWFMVKWSLAAIPALLILAVITIGLFAGLAALGALAR